LRTPTKSEKRELKTLSNEIWAAAFTGDADSQAALGYMFSNGLGFQMNHVMALRWNIKAADSRHSEGCLHLGKHYAEGKGLPRDDEEAAWWFQQVVDLWQNSEAQYNLGLLYYKGIGVKQNTSEAKKWFQMACNDGPETAKPHLHKVIRQNARRKDVMDFLCRSRYLDID